MRYKVIIEKKEYLLPMPVYFLNKEVLDKYVIKNGEESYIDFDVLLEKGSYDELNLISYQCSNTIGSMMPEFSEASDRYNKLGPEIRYYDNMAKMNHAKGDDSKAKENLLKGMELELDFYKRELNLEHERLNQSKSSR